MENGKVNFGYRQVDESAKSSMVRGVFDSVASRYDVMNDLMSAGMHRLWKKEMLKEMRPLEGFKLLDLAAGSGDISFAFANHAKNNNINVSCVTSDINEQMLAVARKRSVDKNIHKNLAFSVVNAEQIPFIDNSFDMVSIAFGIRNVTHIDKVLQEVLRVLKPGGKFICLEFSDVSNAHMKKLYDIYSFKLIPLMGKMVAGDSESYQYLVESIRMFPKAEDFKKMFETAGFSQAKYRKLSGGVVAIHTGFKE